eukprot:COSAG05_NODE_907_length_6645_cov_18.681638_5_plen_132_part_00
MVQIVIQHYPNHILFYWPMVVVAAAAGPFKADQDRFIPIRVHTDTIGHARIKVNMGMRDYSARIVQFELSTTFPTPRYLHHSSPSLLVCKSSLCRSESNAEYPETKALSQASPIGVRPTSRHSDAARSRSY